MKRGISIRLFAAILLGGNVLFTASMRAEETAKVELVQKEFPAGSAEIQILSATLRVSLDLKRTAVVARHNDSSLVVLDGIQGREYDGIGRGSLIFSPDSHHFAYAANRDNNWLLVRDGNEGKLCDALERIVFSPDSRHLACAVNRGRSWAVVVDGAEGKFYDSIGDIVFSAAGADVAYAANHGNKWLVVSGTAAGREYDAIAGIAFSPDGKHLAFGACQGNDWFVVVDGVEGKHYDAVGRKAVPLRTSLAAYAVLQAQPQDDEHGENDNDESSVVAGESGPIFSLDGAHVTFMARRGDRWLIVVDGAESREYDGFLSGSSLRFLTPRSVQAVAIRGRDALRVEIEVQR